MKITGYTATIYFKDQPDTPVENMLISVGDPKTEKEDEKVFFYIEDADDILKLRSNLGSEDFVVTSWQAIYAEEEIVPEVGAWLFVEKYYPNYSSSTLIAHSNDLQKLVDDFWSANNKANPKHVEEFDALQKALKETDSAIYERAIVAFQMQESDRFPNGFEDWQETHFEMVASIQTHMNQDEDAVPNILSLTETMQGLGGLYELASDWTTEFETMHKGKQWGIDDETEYREAIDKFLDEKYKK